MRYLSESLFHQDWQVHRKNSIPPHQWLKKTGKPLIYRFFKDTTIRTNYICEDDLLSLCSSNV
jgi:hypothetical protein